MPYAIVVRALTLGFCLAPLCAAWAQDASQTQEKPDEQIVFAENFEEVAETDNWNGGERWQARVDPACDTVFAVDKDYGKEGKGLEIRNTRTSEEHRCKWAVLSRSLEEVKGQEQFTVSFSYFVPSAKAPHRGRVDFNMTDPKGGFMFFIELGPTAVAFICAKDQAGKYQYARHNVKPAEWHTLNIEVDQKAQKFRVHVDGELVKADWGEWAICRNPRPLSPDRPKSIHFQAAHNWPSSVRRIDDIIVTVPVQTP